jgi:Na+/H+ antiporter NhaD/arsenite permease-like protein
MRPLDTVTQNPDTSEFSRSGRFNRSRLTQRLFALIYAVGRLVTVLLSNDATAVVLTPAAIT